MLIVIDFVIIGGMILTGRWIYLAMKRFVIAKKAQLLEDPPGVNYRMILFKTKSELRPLSDIHDELKKQRKS